MDKVLADVGCGLARTQGHRVGKVGVADLSFVRWIDGADAPAAFGTMSTA